MKKKPKKSHLSSKTPKKAYFGGALAERSSTEKLLEIQIDSDFTFNKYTLTISNKVGKKINAVSRPY